MITELGDVTLRARKLRVKDQIRRRVADVSRTLEIERPDTARFPCIPSYLDGPAGSF